MPHDQFKSVFQERLTRLHAVPRRGPTGVGERDDVELVTVLGHANLFPDHIGEFVELDKLKDGELADRQHERGAEDLDFVGEPAGTRRDLAGVGSPGSVISIPVVSVSCDSNFSLFELYFSSAFTLKSFTCLPYSLRSDASMFFICAYK